MNTGSSGLRDLNGLLIPNITMYRCITYTVIVDGGLDPSNQARYHPFYITSSDRGGYLAKSTAEKQVPISHTRYQYVDTLPNPLLRDRYPFHIQGVNMY